MTSATFITFLLAYIKDLKNDSGLVIQVSQRVMSLLESFKVGLDALHKLNEDQLKQVKESMVENPGHFILKRLQTAKFNQGVLDYKKVASALINTIVDITAKKVPADLPYSTKQLDQLVQKVKFIAVPKNIIQENIYDDVNEEDPTATRLVIK